MNFLTEDSQFSKKKGTFILLMRRVGVQTPRTPRSCAPAHSENHWSKEKKSKELVLKILMPYIENKREELQLSKSQELLLLADVFKGQWT